MPVRRAPREDRGRPGAGVLGRAGRERGVSRELSAAAQGGSVLCFPAEPNGVLGRGAGVCKKESGIAHCFQSVCAACCSLTAPGGLAERCSVAQRNPWVFSSGSPKAERCEFAVACWCTYRRCALLFSGM